MHIYNLHFLYVYCFPDILLEINYEIRIMKKVRMKLSDMCCSVLDIITCQWISNIKHEDISSLLSKQYNLLLILIGNIQIKVFSFRKKWNFLDVLHSTCSLNNRKVHITKWTVICMLINALQFKEFVLKLS